MLPSAFKSFWHAMTSNDRHSNFDSPYRTGNHVPLNPENRRMSALAAVATAADSRQDVSNPYFDDGLNSPMPRSAGFPTSPGVAPPYSPGSRSESARRQSHLNQDGFEVHSPTGEIPMQSFQDGLPPPPSLSHSWRRIDNWAEENYPELFDQLCEGCTTNDLNELEHMLDCSLPMDVRDSLQIHDGQERGGMPSGIIFGSMLLDCEEMVQEWENWRKVNTEFLQQSAAAAAAAAERAKAAEAAASVSGSVDGEGSDEASSSKAPSTAAPTGRPMWRQELQAIQDCIPPNAVQKVYAHPAWIPLVRDWGGNNLAVDLAPGPTGTWGQVIMFGRDYDTKYVIARSWASFVALVADDLASGKWFIDEETNELKLREFKSSRVEPSYFDILRWRADQKYGRRMNKRKSAAPSVVHSPTGSGSPYMSPTDPNNEPRGRPLHRLSSPTPLASPKPGYGKSPLARVTEEASASEPSTAPASAKSEKLVEVETPRVSGEGEAPGKVNSAAVSPVSSVGAASTSSKSKSSAEKVPIAVEAETMKTIEI